MLRFLPVTAILSLSPLAAFSGQAPAAPPPGAPARGGGPPVGAPGAIPTPAVRAQLSFDPTGYWVSMVTHDWRFRMVVPGPGDYAGVPLNVASKRFADAWNVTSEKDECAAYGAPVITQAPGRVRITWQDDNTLKADFDAGNQTRLLQFRASERGTSASPAPSRQGFSLAVWMAPGPTGLPPGMAQAKPASGQIKVVTSDLLPGLLRKNGLPYSGQTRVTEYWNVQVDPVNNTPWLVVVTRVEDPQYLAAPYVFNSIFRREPNGSKWNPSACSLRR